MDVLVRRIASGLRSELCGAQVVNVLSREENPRQGTHASEFVKVEVSNGRTLDLFCKHGKAHVSGSDPFRGGLPGGLNYEAAVHELVLDRDVSPALLGFGSDPGGLGTIFFERLESVRGVSESVPKSAGLCAAAQWIGAFHQSCEPVHRIASTLNHYTRRFYLQWFERAMFFMRDIHVSDRGLRSRYEDLVGAMEGSECVIHGDLYSDQVLLGSRGLHVVDWELAAVACGEIDLATLTLGRPPELLNLMTSAYVAARWDGHPPASFSERLLGAQFFLLLRLLGVSKDWPHPKKYQRRVRMFLELGQKIGAERQ